MDPEELYQEYARIIYRYIYLKCRDADLAEEILQTTFLKAIQQVDTFRGKAKVSTWLCQIAKNEYLNFCRKNNRKLHYEDSLQSGFPEDTGPQACYGDNILEMEPPEQEMEAWNRSIEPLRKVKKKLHRKNLSLGIAWFFLLLVIAFNLILCWGQIFRTGISFSHCMRLPAFNR